MTWSIENTAASGREEEKVSSANTNLSTNEFTYEGVMHGVIVSQYRRMSGSPPQRDTPDLDIS